MATVKNYTIPDWHQEILNTINIHRKNAFLRFFTKNHSFNRIIPKLN